MPLCKLRELSELVITHAVHDDAYFLVGFEVVADHTRVVEDLFCALGNRLWKGAVEMKGFSHNQNFLTFGGCLLIRSPSIELVCGVWEQNAIIFCFNLLDDLEELSSDL